MTRPKLLLCFDAFGTLFKPSVNVAHQYAHVARLYGVSGFGDDDLQACLRAAIKEESRKNPNYGRATGLGATKWWTNVIHNTFSPLLRQGQSLPKALSQALLHRFSTSEGYGMEPELVSTLKALKHQHHTQRRFDRVVVGVITNSDDRVPNILSSFGLEVSSLRYGVQITDPHAISRTENDIDFHCMSYDVGVEKPEKPIFDAATSMLAHVIEIQDNKSTFEAKFEAESWSKLYVGDDYAKDVVGSAKAGWNPVLLDPEQQFNDVAALEESPSESLEGVFKDRNVVRVPSIHELIIWLLGVNKLNPTV